MVSDAQRQQARATAGVLAALRILTQQAAKNQPGDVSDNYAVRIAARILTGHRR